jgi:N-acetylmuramoyl-L-alanine amidase
VLLEVGVLPNKTEEQKLETAEYRAIMIKAILDALESYCLSTLQ